MPTKQHNHVWLFWYGFSITMLLSCALRVGGIEDKSQQELATTGPASPIAAPEAQASGVGNVGQAIADAESKTIDQGVDASSEVSPEVAQAGAINTSIQYVAAAGGIGAVLTLLIWQWFTARSTRLADTQETRRMFVVLNFVLSLFGGNPLSRRSIAEDRNLFGSTRRRRWRVLEIMAVAAAGACVGIVAFLGWQHFTTAG